MPKGPTGQRRPGDVIGPAIKVAKIAIGEVNDETMAGRNCSKKVPDRRETPSQKSDARTPTRDCQTNGSGEMRT